MYWKAIAAAVLILPTGQAFADSTQLALSTGVQPGSLTVAEMAQLRRDIEEDNRDGAARRVKHAMEKGSVAVTRASSGE